MKRLLVFAAVLTLVATPVMAALGDPLDRSDYPIYTAVGQEIGAKGEGTGPIVYSTLAGPYASFSPATGPLGWDDYDTISPTQLTAVKFVGGVATAPGVLWFDFFTYTSFATGTTPLGTSPAGGFGVQLTQAGNFIWTIHAGSDPLITIPHTGIMQITANSTTGYGIVSGQWFLTTTPPSVGSNNPDHGGAPPYYHAFEFRIPEPGTVALLGVGLVFLGRRRR